jgi:quinol monooxygenase YgiN
MLSGPQIPERNLGKVSPCQVTLIPFFVIKAGEVDAVRKAHLSVIDSTRAEPGCLTYDLYQCLDDPSTMFFHENWTDQRALEKHMNTPNFYRVVRGEVDKRLVVPWTALRLTMVG